MAGVRVHLHVCLCLGDAVHCMIDYDGSLRMIAMHSMAIAEPRQLLWVIASDNLPPGRHRSTSSRSAWCTAGQLGNRAAGRAYSRRVDHA